MQFTKNTAAVRKDAVTMRDIVIPEGYSILVALSTLQKKTAGGIEIPDEIVQRDQTAQICAYVVDLGPDAFCDEKRFPNGPRCKVGDWIIMKSYAGVRFKIRGEEVRLINDDDVLAKLPNGPLEIERA